MKAVHVRERYASTIFKTDTMPKTLRIIPPVCLSVAILELLCGKLRLSREFVGRKTKSDDGQIFTVFRQIKNRKAEYSDNHTTFVVRFKFARLSHKTNKWVSIIPMLVIAGFPGFIQKLYAVNEETGYWQGMYAWRSAKHLEAYRQSFVFQMMKKRAQRGTVQEQVIPNRNLSDLIEPDKSKKG